MTKKGSHTAPPALHVTLLGGFRISAGGATESGQDVLEDRAWRLRKAAALVKLPDFLTDEDRAWVKSLAP